MWDDNSPSTFFDCSGFVSYMLTNSGLYSTGRLDAQVIFNISTLISDPHPAYLAFFVSTYDTTGVFHVGDKAFLHRKNA